LPPTRPTAFPYTTLFRSHAEVALEQIDEITDVLLPDGRIEPPRFTESFDGFLRRIGRHDDQRRVSGQTQNDKSEAEHQEQGEQQDRKSTRLNSSHVKISY